MNRTTTGLLVVALLTSCAKKDDTPAPATAQTPQGYPQSGYPATAGYPPPNGAQAPMTPGMSPPMNAGAAPAGQYPQPQAVTAPGAAAPSGMATPGPLALACQNDQACGLAHCNTAYGKCAFPCAGPVDCIQGASCNTMTGLCLPGTAP